MKEPYGRSPRRSGQRRRVAPGRSEARGDPVASLSWHSIAGLSGEHTPLRVSYELFDQRCQFLGNRVIANVVVTLINEPIHPREGRPSPMWLS